MYLRNMLSVCLPCLLGIVVLAVVYPIVFLFCLHQMWRSFLGAWEYRSTLYIVVIGVGQILLLAAIIAQVVFGVLGAMVLWGKSRDSFSYYWYVRRGGIPHMYGNWLGDKHKYRFLAFGVTNPVNNDELNDLLIAARQS
jgi:hypothetical protein